MNTLYGEDISF